MNTFSLQSQLNQFESQLAFLSDALVQHRPSEVLTAASELQAVAVALSAALPKMAIGLKNRNSDQLRVKAIAAKLASLREVLLRQNVGVNLALAALMPATQTSTYAPQTGLSVRRPYGSAGRQSGEFKAFSI